MPAQHRRRAAGTHWLVQDKRGDEEGGGDSEAYASLPTARLPTRSSIARAISCLNIRSRSTVTNRLRSPTLSIRKRTPAQQPWAFLR